MFDAKSILDMLVRGGAQPQGGQPQGDFGGFGDLLKQLGQGGLTGGRDAPRGGARQDDDDDVQDRRAPRTGRREEDEDDDDDDQKTPSAIRRGTRGPMDRDDDEKAESDIRRSGFPRREADEPQGGGTDLEEMLRKVLGGGQGGGGAGGLGDILGKLQQGGGGGGLGDILGQILGGGGATGAARFAGDSSSGRSPAELVEQLKAQFAGRSPAEILEQIKALIANNQMAAGAALGGLGGLLLGTRTGRSVAGSAIKLGGLAVIGGLAYRAYQNYQQGQAAPTAGKPQALLAAPKGSGFEADAVSNEQAMTYIRAMIAAADADGRIDEAERANIVGNLKQGGIGSEAEAFLKKELQNPASVDDLADAVTSPEEAVKIYTAARIAISVDSEEEHEFLAELADALGLDAGLVSQVDATARSAAA